MYPVQIPGNTFADKYNMAYLQSVHPEVFNALWYNSGTFGIPITGVPLPAIDMASTMKRLAIAESLAKQGFLVTLADVLAQAPYDWMLSLKTQKYPKFSYVGQTPEDWKTAPPGQSLPGMIDYDPTTHTGVVSFALLPPYSGPMIEPTKYVGLRANNDNGGEYNGDNGAETKFSVGDAIWQDGVQYVFIGSVNGSPCWQYAGR